MQGIRNNKSRNADQRSGPVSSLLARARLRGFPAVPPGLTYALLLALAVALFYWKTLLTRQFTFIIGSEAVNQSYSWLIFWVRSVRALQFPLWDPYAFAGWPFAAEM